VREQVANGVTVLLTTQYLDEADQLADQIVVIDRGVVIAEGTTDQLKRKVGADRLEISVARPEDIRPAIAALESVTSAKASIDAHRNRISVPLGDRMTELALATSSLRESGIDVLDFSLRKPSLDDVFFSLTGSR
jgi:ABC-2 type transport system ATP-binding protein